MISTGEIESKVNKALLDEFDLEEEDLKPEASFQEDLGLDSLDGIDLVVAIERAFRDYQVKIPQKEARAMTHLKDIYSWFEHNLDKNT